VLRLILRGENSSARGGTPNTILAGHDINVCNERRDGHLQISRDLKLPMKLEKSIQRASKSQGGIVGQIRKLAVVVESELIFHEILLIQKSCCENERMMEHHKSIIYQELRATRA